MINSAAIVIPPLTTEERDSALRFCETCEDGQDYDVPKPMMKRLAELGLVVYKCFGRYEGTPTLDALQAQHDAELVEKAPKKRMKP